MKFLKALALSSAFVASGIATAADDEAYILPTQSIILACDGSEFQEIPKEEFDKFFARAIPVLQEVKNEGGLIGSWYLTDIRAGIMVGFQDSETHTAVENSQRFQAKIAEVVEELGTPIAEDSCKTFEIGGQMM